MSYVPTFCHPLHRCTDLATGERLHSCAVISGWSNHTFVANLLVRMYGRCGDVERALTVFNNIQQRDVISWNVMMAAYADNGHLHKAKAMFDSMPDRSAATWTTMISGYGKVGDVDSARELFDSLQCKTREAWNAMISVYARNGHCSEAFQTFQLMLLHGIRPNEPSFMIKFPGTSVNDEGNFFQICKVAHECGLDQSSPAVATVFVVWLSKLGRYIEAKHLFEGVDQKDPVLCTAMVGVYAANGYLQLAERMFHDLPVKDLPAWNAMIKAYSDMGHIPQAESLFEKAPDKNLVTWTTMVAAYARDRLYCTKAVKTFCLMDLEGTRPNRVTFLEVLDACGGGLVSAGRMIHSEIRQLGLENDVRIATAIVSMYGSCSSLADTKSMFDSLTCRRTVVAWTSLMTANARLGDWEQCLEVFKAMLLDGVAPNQVTFLSLLCACSRGGELTRAVFYCGNMYWDYACEVTEAHYVCLLDMFGRAGFGVDSHDLIRNMPYHPGIAAWTNVLSSSRGSSALAAAQQLHSLHRGNSEVPYVLFSNFCTQ